MASDWEVEDEVVVGQRTLPEDDAGRRTEFVLQKLRLEASGGVAFRFGYRYRYDDGRSQWVPNSPRLPPEELGELVGRAVEQGWLNRDLVRQLTASARPLAAESLVNLRHRVEGWVQDLLGRIPVGRGVGRTGS